MYEIKLFVGLVLCIMSGFVTSDQCLGEQQIRKYFKVKKCRRSDAPILSRNNFGTLNECIAFARDKNGLAINYSPPEAKRKLKRDEYFYNCIVLGCPETMNQTTLVNDTAYDYYSSYANFTVLENATCVKNLGMFRLFQNKENYSTAIDMCQEIGGDLANILSEQRTNALSNLVASEMSDWYKAAYVGLDDVEREGLYRTSLGDSIQCYKFRAWSPGHPYNVIKNDDCVVLDSERSWKVVDCRRKLAFLCEYFPTSTKSVVENYDCDDLEDEEERRECRLEQRNKLRNRRRKRNRCLEDD